jgi:hypothetical protein
VSVGVAHTPFVRGGGCKQPLCERVVPPPLLVGAIPLHFEFFLFVILLEKSIVVIFYFLFLLKSVWNLSKK